ncbi:MAG: DUF2892 domain-containing protein [archaeon]|nr:DUF2892 domain-containing protein [archaeon]
MKRNMGDKDRALRIILGVLIFPSAVIGQPFAWATLGCLSNLLGLVGIILLVTGSIGVSLLFSVLGIDTSEKKMTPKVKSVAADVKKPAAKKKKTVKKAAKKKGSGRKK